MARKSFYTCLSFCSRGRGCLAPHPPWQPHTPLGRYTPPGRHPPRLTHPLSIRWSLQRTVHILLECILGFFFILRQFISEKFGYCMDPLGFIHTLDLLGVNDCVNFSVHVIVKSRYTTDYSTFQSTQSWPNGKCECTNLVQYNPLLNDKVIH